jgi:aminomethyltransferase
MLGRFQRKLVTKSKNVRCFGEELKTTSLFNYHTEKLNAAKMIPFAGYAMPAFYKGWGIKSEHEACRDYAAIFDVSHMGQLKFYGDDRLEFLETVYTTDFASLNTGEAKLSLILNENGGIIDDSIMSNFGDHHHAVINAGNTDIDLAHFDQVLEERFQGKDVRYEVLKDRALLALQGPASMDILQNFVEEDLTQMPFMTIIETELKDLGITAIICRCGYTGKLKTKIHVLTPNRRRWIRNFRRSRRC